MGIASGNAIWRHAARTKATLISKDEDFAALAARERSGPRVVWLRVGNISNDALWRIIDPHLDEIVQALNAGERVVEIV
jgi:predicted nuclease of predicted toxin-antitoxin system